MIRQKKKSYHPKIIAILVQTKKPSSIREEGFLIFISQFLKKQRLFANQHCKMHH